jgi:hypothetical protein
LRRGCQLAIFGHETIQYLADTLKTRPIKKKSAFPKDRRRKHHHWQVVVSYHDGEKFARVYTDRKKAISFATRQKRSPVVKSARVTEVG